MFQLYSISLPGGDSLREFLSDAKKKTSSHDHNDDDDDGTA